MPNPHEKKRSPRLPVMGKKVRVSGRKKIDRFFHLQGLADLLNGHRPGLQLQQTEGKDPHLHVFVQMVKHAVYSVPFIDEGSTLLTKGHKPVLVSPFMGIAVGEFNRLAREFPGPLQLLPAKDAQGKRIWIPTVETPGRIGLLLWVAWEELFRRGGWERLRECIHCRTWFVDRGKNRQARWCSRACTNRWWTRDRRRRFGGQRRKKRGPASQRKGG